ncbi:hypothetical protein CAPTEDRAFT_121915 [Capitella teleta]|uniref:DEP domain-containing protein n=1 Tax=Capitella teleta TaxID=283909 RepID=R7UMT2_CAPTE|nr:hypothetical protein CAPTEDRAFT_121915 [Capitella teleta]|eukprot:ELU07844.1 hypothetical protein CAPTEDRAFT_121915 [Capitella teleta]
MAIFYTALTNATQTPPPQSSPLENLYPAIVQCFVVISSGYLAGRTGSLSAPQAQGIGAYVSKFALPALLFRSMCTLELSSINWYFLSSFLLAKTAVFMAIFLVTLVFSKDDKMAQGGLYAIFATQSNDFALGYPIVSALYADSHPHFVDYLYLVAPISLVFLNPIGFTFLEINKARSPEERSQTKCKTAANVFLGVVSNPIIFMTVLGIGGNFAFNKKLPEVLDKIFQIFGDSYSATALFYLGHSMVGKVQKQSARSLVVMALLVVAKQICLPLVCRGLAELLLHWSPTAINQTERVDMESFAFLYGTFPTAPSVFLFASQYAIAMNVIATSLVVCTFLSGPLMFISAKMVMMRTVDPSNYMSIIHSTTLNVSALTMALSVWVLVVLFIGRRLNSVPHQMTVCLILSQMLFSLGVILNTYLPDIQLVNVINYTLVVLGTFSSRVWGAVIAISVCLIRVRGLCFLLSYRCVIMLVGFCIPTIFTAVLVILNAYFHTSKTKIDIHVFSLTVIELSLTMSLVSLSLICVIGAIIVLNRHNRLEIGAESRTVLTSEEEQTEESGPDLDTLEDRLALGRKLERRGVEIENTSEDLTTSSSLANTLLLPNGGRHEGCTSGGDRCTPEQHRKCAELVKKYKWNQDEIASAISRNEHQITRHVVLMVFLLISAFVELTVCVCRILRDNRNGIRIEIEFFNCVLMYGQGIFTFFIFGLETEVILSPFLRRVRRIFFGGPTILLPSIDDLPPETNELCRQFVTHHRDNCMKAIVGCRRYRLRRYRNVFLGTELVDWLLSIGLASDVTSAVEIGNKLLYGRIIQHVRREQVFCNQPYLYCFVHFESLAITTIET